MNRELLFDIVAQASHAPSVHNTQPVRWQFSGNDGLVLCLDKDTHLDHGDPDRHDMLLSAGAALEGAVLAASSHGYRTDIQCPSSDGDDEGLAILRFLKGSVADPLSSFAGTRTSWRGAFASQSKQARQEAKQLVLDGCHVFADQAELEQLGTLADEASFHFMRDDSFRLELLSWMRLGKKHPRWALDGMNARAMQLNGFEAFGAGIVLGRAFGALDRLGLTKPILAEAKRIANASGLAILHRPVDEGALESGRHFYRVWLQMEKAGFAAQVVAALADHDKARKTVHAMADLANDRKIISAWVFGKLPEGAKLQTRARLPLEQLVLR